ncbi:hypothetical protein H9649_09195 [Sporosarcina sp. Sa2YVA2]|uniref:Uncharacterized protein n=1 Tax=Sporosarcina quadrami TaxID=2762234 RepID=A0ABR8U9Q9_9BACL|nr:hypothetical protein [Sporosarcina quadrami]MBD7984756.1 hypothetical protein [Sporosarcina quadrami]
MKYIQVLGIVMFAMIGFSFLMVLAIPNFLLHSTIVMIFTYGLLGYLSRSFLFPYFSAYMLACALVVFNILFSQFFYGLPMLFEPDIALFSFVTATMIAIVGVYIFRKLEARRAHS